MGKFFYSLTGVFFMMCRKNETLIDELLKDKEGLREYLKDMEEYQNKLLAVAKAYVSVKKDGCDHDPCFKVVDKALEELGDFIFFG